MIQKFIHIKTIFFIVIALFIGVNGYGQLLKKVFKEEDFSGRVYISYPDSKGYLWIGTNAGLYRWDSKKLIHYTISDGLPNNEVLNIYEDSKGRLWLSTYSNQLCYVFENKIYNAENNKELMNAKVSMGTTIKEFDGKLYMGDMNTKIGNDYIETIENNRLDKLLETSDLKIVLSNIRPNLLFSANNTLWLFPSDKNIQWYYYYDFIHNKIYKKFNRVSKENYVNQIYLKGSYLLYKDFLTNKTYIYDSTFAVIDSFQMHDKNSKLFCKTNSRYFLYDSSGVYIFEEGKKTMYVDIGSEMWGQNHKAGNQYFNTGYNAYFINSKQLYNIRTLYSGNVKRLFFQNNNLFASNKNELFSLGFPERKISKEIYNDKSSLYNTYSNDNKIIFTTAKSILYYNQKTNKIEQLYPTILKSLFIEDLLGFAKADKFEYSQYNYKYSTYFKGKFMFASSIGIFIEEGSFFRQLYTKRVISFFVDSKNRIWFSTLDGNFLSTTFYPQITDNFKLKLNTEQVQINDYKEDEKGNVLLATNDGLYIYSPELKRYHIDKNTILNSNECSKLYIDADKTIWMATDMGLVHLRYYQKPNTPNRMRFERINSFSKSDGVGADIINDFIVAGDSIYIATEKGITLVVDKNYRPDTTTISININHFYVNTQEVDLDSTAQFRSDENSIGIDFSAIYFERTNRLRIYYQLIKDGDTTVVQNINESNILFQSLAYGKYTVIVNAYDADYPYIKGQSKPIVWVISPPFYKTWWFIGMVFLSLFGVFALVLYQQFKQRAAKLTYEKELSRLKLEALKAEMNPHFVFNCLNGIKDYMMQQNFEQSQYYLSVLSKLIRLALYNTKTDFVLFEDEIKFIDMYVEMEQMRFAQKFDYIKNIKDFHSGHIRVPTMILQPFFENAVRHGRIGQLPYQGKLLFEITDDDDFIKITIKDNGVGFAVAKELNKQTDSDHKSMALQIIQDRLFFYEKSYGIKILIATKDLTNEEYKTEITITLEKENL